MITTRELDSLSGTFELQIPYLKIYYVKLEKERNKMDKIIKIRESLFNMQICTTITPEEKDTINDELRRCGLDETGIRSKWSLDYNIEPVKCEDYEGRWHYICVC